MNKVFGIGLSKTGTHSLAAALERLGYKTLHYPPPGQVLALAEQYDALVDTPVLLHLAALDERYPEARFVLTTRQTGDWLESCRKHWQRHEPDATARLVRRWVYGMVAFEKRRFREVWYWHHAYVRALFAERPEKLLVLNIVAGEGYEKLCPFLGLPVVDEPFPHKFKAPEVAAWN